MDIFDLTGQTAIVTGGTGALGGAIAKALAAAGANIAIVGRDAERGAQRVAEIEGSGRRALFCRADVLNRADLEATRDAVLGTFGSFEVLVNGAGGNVAGATLAPGDAFSDLALEAWQSAFDLNLVGGVLLPTQVLGAPMLAQGRGSVINIASLSGMTALSRVVAYSAAKAAVLNLTQFLAREWATRGVRVNALSPGFFPAEQNRALLFREDGTPTERGAQILGHTPMKRFGSADELAGAVVFLAAERASRFVTGHNLVVDGGFSAMTI